MKIFLEIDIKPFRGKNKNYSGLYTPRGRRNQRARIEIDSEDSMLTQIWALTHEIGHFICDMYLGEVHKKTPKEEEREHKFCRPLADSGERLFKRFLSGT